MPTRVRERTDYIIVHSTFSQPDFDISVAELDKRNRKQGWLECMYHYVIRRDGSIERGRDPERIGGGVYGYNDCSLHVCLIGGKSPDQGWMNNYTPEQNASLRILLKELLIFYPDAKVRGRRDFPGSEHSPGFDVQAWWTRSE